MKILIASPIFPEAIDKLREEHEVICAFDAKDDTLQSLITDCEVLVFRSGVNISGEVMAQSPKLKLLVRAGSGIDNLDLDYVQQHGLELVRVPEPGAKAVSEMSFAFMLALARDLINVDRVTREGHWIKHKVTAYLLTGKVLGVIGAGNIGSRTGQLGAAWGMTVLGCVEHPTPEVEARLKEKGVRLAPIQEVVAAADFLSIHVPLKDTTRGMVNAAMLGHMKPGAYLINLARGGVVDEEALYNALTSGQLRGAALDVHRAEGEGKISPLAALPNVILTPHVGASTVDSQREIGHRVVEVVAALTRRNGGAAR